MNALKLTLSLLIALFMISCATSQSSSTGSDYQNGYNMARTYAKKDAMNSRGCFRYEKYAGQKAREYTQLLQDQGRSKIFIRGFLNGYENDYVEFADLYCGP